ncbi:MAG: PAS domain S-box protein [Ferruginibacter sp.]
MHKQLTYKATWEKKKSFLLFVLFFSFLLTGIAAYLFSYKNNWVEKELASPQPGLLQANSYSTWAYVFLGTALLMMLSVFASLLREIRHHEKTNNELREKKEHYKVTINSIAEGLITTGKEGEVLYMNPAAEKLTGLSSSEAKNLPLEKVYEPVNKESRKPIKNILSGILRKGQSIQFENSTSVNTKNQHQVILSNSGSPLFDAEGNISGAVLLFNDISERKQNEKKLEDSEIFSRGILDALNSHVAVINSSGTIIKANKAWNGFALEKGITDSEQYGEGSNYLAMCKSLSIVEDGTCSEAWEGIKKVFDGKLDKFYLEYCSPTSSDDKWFYMRAMKFESVETLVVIEHHDITERKKEETKTLKAIEQYDILSKATSDTIWDWDIPHNQILYNDGITKMFGYKVSEVDNAVEWWQKNIHPDDLQRVTEALSEVFKKGIQNLQLEYRFRCSGNTYKSIYDRAFVIYDAQGGPRRIIGAMQDVTYEKEEEKRIAKAIIDAQEQERRYIGQELHDNVNQILAGSLLTIAMAKQKHITIERLFELLNISEEYLVHAIDEVRKLSHRLAPAFFDEMTLKDIFEDLLMKINLDNQFKIKFHFDEKINVLTSGDIQINLYRILQEEVKNILKYSAANAIEITLSLSDNIVQMKTFDNGKGFDLKTVKKGIGLSNIKKRVDSFSGKCIVNSAPGRGCEIIVEIPLDDVIEYPGAVSNT